MSKKVRVDFYRVDTKNPSVLFEDVIQKISAFPQDESRNVVIRGFPIRLQDSSSQRPGCWWGDLVRIRMNNIPTKASLSGEVEPLDLEDDEGLGEETAFLYHIPTKVLMIQRNRLGVSAAAFSTYCKKICQLSEDIDFDPILRGDVLTRLRQMSIIRRFDVKTARLEDLSILKGQDLGVNEILNIGDIFGALNVSLTVSVGKKKKMSLENVITTAISLFRHASANTGNVKKIEISGANDEDEKSETIDLLEYWITAEIDIDPADLRLVSYAERLQALEQAWNQKKDEIQQMFPPHH